jgi:hypothetical protein
MSKKDFLFELPEKVIQKKTKEISLKKWEKWEMCECFIEVLCGIETDKIFFFNTFYRRGELFFSIVAGWNTLMSNMVTENDLILLGEHFEDNYYEVNRIYLDLYDSEKRLTGICIKGRKE